MEVTGISALVSAIRAGGAGVVSAIEKASAQAGQCRPSVAVEGCLRRRQHLGSQQPGSLHSRAPTTPRSWKGAWRRAGTCCGTEAGCFRTHTRDNFLTAVDLRTSATAQI